MIADPKQTATTKSLVGELTKAGADASSNGKNHSLLSHLKARCENFFLTSYREKLSYCLKGCSFLM